MAAERVVMPMTVQDDVYLCLLFIAHIHFDHLPYDQ